MRQMPNASLLRLEHLVLHFSFEDKWVEPLSFPCSKWFRCPKPDEQQSLLSGGGRVIKRSLNQPFRMGLEESWVTYCLAVAITYTFRTFSVSNDWPYHSQEARMWIWPFYEFPTQRTLLVHDITVLLLQNIVWIKVFQFKLLSIYTGCLMWKCRD